MNLNTNTPNGSNEALNECIIKLKNLSQEIDSFLSCDSQKSQQFIDLTKSIFDLNKQLVNENINHKSKVFSIKTSLNELFTNGFDLEQIWQQMELQNQPLVPFLVKEVSVLSLKSTLLGLNIQTERHKKAIELQNNSNEKRDNNSEMDETFSESESVDGNNDFEDKNELKSVKDVKSKPKSVVDDMFFKLHELEEFLNKEDIKEDRIRSGTQELMSEESDEDIDYFVDSDTEDEEEVAMNDMNGRDAMFSDFFDGPNDGNVVRNTNEANDEDFDEENEEMDEEVNEEMDTRDVDINDITGNDKDIDLDLDETSSSEEDEPFHKRKVEAKDDSNDTKSEFEKISVLLKEKIGKQERENLTDKSWQLRGEIASDKRPENSLLEEHLHFDHTSKPKPLITEETTVKLEDIIKQRVKDNAFDDVVRKVKPKEKPFEYRRRITMESEKSKQSLAQIYENEYLKQQQKEREDEEHPEQTKVNKMMRSLFLQLDALSNFNFTPRPPQPEIKIINNLPAITAEEVTPLAASDVQLLAPQEVFNTQKRELQTKAEKSKTDRKRDRRLKKVNQRKRIKYNQNKEMAKKKTKVLKDKSEDGNHLSSSTKFFTKLQEQTTPAVVESKSKKKSKKVIKQSNQLKL